MARIWLCLTLYLLRLMFSLVAFYHRKHILVRRFVCFVWILVSLISLLRTSFPPRIQIVDGWNVLLWFVIVVSDCSCVSVVFVFPLLSFKPILLAILFFCCCCCWVVACCSALWCGEAGARGAASPCGASAVAYLVHVWFRKWGNLRIACSAFSSFVRNRLAFAPFAQPRRLAGAPPPVTPSTRMARGFWCGAPNRAAIEEAGNPKLLCLGDDRMGRVKPGSGPVVKP